MRKITGLSLALMLLHTIAFSQDDKYIQNPTLGVHFFFNDFTTASLIRATSLSTVLNKNQFGKLKQMSPGLALSYIYGYTTHFDFTSTLAGSFLEYPRQDGTKSASDGLLLEGDVSIRGKMFSNAWFLSPWIQLGGGISKYKGYWAAYVPAGVGLQLNLFDEAYLLINAQYRMPVTEQANYHFFYSLGLSGNIGKRKDPKPRNIDL